MNLILIHFFTLCLNIGYTHLLLAKKTNIKYTFFILLSNCLISLFIYTFSYTFLRYTIFHQWLIYISEFSFIIYISLVFEESNSKKIFTMVTIWLFSNLILIISNYIVRLFPSVDSNLYIFSSILLRNFIQLMFIHIMYLYFKRKYKQMLKLVSNKVINIISFYSIIIFIFLIRYYEFCYYDFNDSYGVFNSLLLIVIIILSYIIIFITISSVSRNIELEYKFKIVDTQIEIQKQNYKTLNESIKNYYAFKHDIRHHLLAIKSMMDAENYVEASEYLDKFNENEISQNIGTLCKNFTVDSILKYYMGIATTYNIDFKVRVNIPQDINIDNLDLSIVIGNCVENAIEACNKIIDKSQKYIYIKAEIKGFNLVIKINNTFNGQVVKVDKIIKTSKEMQEHGIGLSNVRKIAEKYNGFFDVKYTEYKFEVNIVMNFKDSSE
ncbi:MAG: two-component system sensor histidine kinase AgrC [Clostridium sp.]|jgi:two-component system sensor histidine kinase AgrC